LLFKSIFYICKKRNMNTCFSHVYFYFFFWFTSETPGLK